VLSRFAYTPHGTFGRLNVDGFECFTVERPWNNNQRNISCIPTGRYHMTLGTHRRNTPDTSDDYPAYELHGVPGRSLIKVHVGNTINDIKGCIALGTNLGYVDGHWAVGSSQAAYAQWMTAMAEAPEAYITVIDVFPYYWGDLWA
jgi:hypothetical protein